MPETNRTPAISVVLPVYNGQRFLDESIRSVVDQTFDDWELIIIDDCSTDETPQIIARWIDTDKRIGSHRNETNLKLPGSLNRGFSHARGRYFTWTSDDNRYLPNAFHVLCDRLNTPHGPDIGYAEHALINDQGHVWRERIPVVPTELLLHRNGFGACFLYKAEVHTALNGYDEMKFLVEDYDFWLRALVAGFTFQPIHEVHYEYRLHPDSLSSQQKGKIEQETLKLQSSLAARCNQLPSQVRAQAYLSYATAYAKRHERQMIWQSMISAFSLSPWVILKSQFWRMLLKSLIPNSAPRTATCQARHDLPSK